MKKFLVLIMSLIMTTNIFCLTGCFQPPEEGGGEVEGKTNIHISIGDNGVGTDFLYNLKAEYEKFNPEVNIVITNKDTELSNGLDYIKSADEDIIYFTGVEKYTEYERYLFDMTALTNKKAYDADGEYVREGGVKSLADKMKAYENTYNLFNQGTKEAPKFVSLPWFSALYGLWYDKDLFYSEGYYNLPEYKGLDNVLNSGDENFGPDGKENTYDDGLPSTWEDMKILLKTMTDGGLRPFAFSGKYSWMRNFWLDVVLMNYEGMNDYLLNYTFNGTDSDFGAIDASNGYLLKQQEGKKATLMVADKIARDKLYSQSSLYTTQTHLGAQTDFLKGITRDEGRSAFLIDGSWWEYEARDTFNSMARTNPNWARGKRNFGYFPIPRFVGTEGLKDQTNTTQYIRDSSSYVITGVKSTKHPEIVEDFLLFAHSNTSLVNFSKTTNLFCSYDYTMSQEDQNTLTPMAKEIYNLLRSEDVELYFSGESVLSSNGATAGVGSNSLRAKNSGFFDNWELRTMIGNKQLIDPIRDIAYDETGTYTFESWFNGFTTIDSAKKWNEYFK